MIFAKDLILKGVAGLAVVGSLGAGGIYVWNQRKEESLQFLAEKVGLECTAGAAPTVDTGVQCNKKNGENVKVKVKQDADASIEVSTITTGSIKVYKAEASEGYNKDFKFVIEGGDISASTPSTSKLEQFETYEIKEENNQWYLTRREKAVDVKKKRLGLPSDAECKLPENNDTATCTLDKDKLKAINFDGKTDGDVTIDNEGGEDIKLKISKVTDTANTPFTEGYKFVLETNKNITIPGTTSIYIKKGTNTEFKIKKSGTGNGTTFSLEKAWTLEELIKKVGLENCTGTTYPKECGFTTSKVNLFNGADDYTKGASFSDNSKKIKVEVDQEGHNQGFKFYVEGEDIALQDGTPNGSGDKKIVKRESGNPTYEIKEQSPTSGTKDWYLSKVTVS